LTTGADETAAGPEADGGIDAVGFDDASNFVDAVPREKKFIDCGGSGFGGGALTGPRNESGRDGLDS